MIMIHILIMAGITNLVRMIPIAIFKKKIESNFIKSFLYYVPFAVLGSMTFPAIFTSTSSLYSAIAGTAVAILLAFKEKSLLTVALSSCFAVYITEWILKSIDLF